MKALLQWTAAGGNPDGYYIYRSPTTSQGVRVGTSTTPNFTDPSVEAGQRYYFSVTAYNAGGESPPSAQDSITVPDDVAPPDAPTGLTVTLGP